jgi:hypothetical protein
LNSGGKSEKVSKEAASSKKGKKAQPVVVAAPPVDNGPNEKSRQRKVALPPLSPYAYCLSPVSPLSIDACAFGNPHRTLNFCLKVALIHTHHDMTFCQPTHQRGSLPSNTFVSILRVCFKGARSRPKRSRAQGLGRCRNPSAAGG